MLLRKLGVNNFVRWNGEAIGGIHHPRNIEYLWTQEQLAEIDLFFIKKTPVPDDKISNGVSYIQDGNLAKEVHDLTDKTYTTHDVLSERDRRISQNFNWNGNMIQGREDDRENIMGATVSATLAVMNGVQPGDTKWAGGNTDFTWIVANNSTIVLDAYQMIDMGQTAMGVKKFYIYKAKDIKESVEANPTINPTNDALWTP